ncbi:Proteophosphoglycan ppg4 [Mycena indigotica]|uniref:Proteophosphoglycan ppg4 n=1 Tax=Mycena indigotica TaxID=2126181 RepID=A0A8H6VWL3_9AGAR|nr:Proteophosphoglycan ppg4 [Mycena indigotica]KAF7294601.1 Proteophosphoglycan ppg4 [Mycena indigotica]
MYILPRALGTGNNNSPNLAPSTWVPVAVVIGVLLVLSTVVCSRRLRSRIPGLANSANAASTTTATGTRELTAEQLAGTINANPTAPPRRTRRPRRTPSQISTVSLPAYMKEPGELELVVTRGPDEEDVTIPPPSTVGHDEQEGGEEEEETAASQRRQSTVDNSRYSPMPQSPHDTPLLGPDPRGEAPAYFEVVDNDHYPPPGISATDTPPEVSEPEPAVVPQRRSGFFSMFRPAPTAVSLPTPGESSANLSLTHTRTRSTTHSTHSPASPSTPLPSSSRHRPSTSTSTLFSLRRKKSSQSLSANNLTSPSLISLSSISSPLPHTLVKTEFTSLPKAGLTPEQFKMISGNKDGGLNRFGVPFGDVAVAYAQASANASRVGLGLEDDESEPPRWEEVAGPSTLLPEPSTVVSEAGEVLESSQQLELFTTVSSRASGQTFATAQEFSDESESPPTAGHAQEATDATIRP